MSATMTQNALDHKSRLMMRNCMHPVLHNHLHSVFRHLCRWFGLVGHAAQGKASLGIHQLGNLTMDRPRGRSLIKTHNSRKPPSSSSNSSPYNIRLVCLICSASPPNRSLSQPSMLRMWSV